MRFHPMALLALAVAAPAQRPDAAFLRKGTFADRPALLLANDKLELTVMPRGGALASVVLRDDPDKLNPLWDPARMARELGEKSGFGAGTGHFVCVDGFGPVSPEERAAGFPGHGEAHVQPWEVRFSGKEAGAGTVTFAATLPLAQEVLTRTLRMVDGENVIYVQSELESRLGFDRPVCWAEHATIGSPFLEPGVTAVDMPARRAQTRPWEGKQRGMEHRLASGKDFTWPMAPGAKRGKIDVRVAPKQGGTGDHTTCLLDPARKLVFVTALHPGRRLVLGYLFRREDFPWLQSWEYYPASMKWARGMEFSTQAYDVPRRQVIQISSMFGAPLYRWLPAKSKIESRFLLFYARTPEGFRKVDDVRLEGGRLIIEDRKARRRVELPASLGL